MTHTAGADPRRVRSSDRFTNRDLLTQLPVPGKMLDTSTSHGGQDQVASRRVVPTRRVNRDPPGKVVHDRGQVLQRSWHGGTMDQGKPELPQVDEYFLPLVQGQPDAIAVVYLGLQLFELPASPGPFLGQ